MKYFFTVSVFALAMLLGACITNPTTPPTTTGEIYGEAKLYNEYRVLLTDRSGLTVQLLEQGNVKQTIVTAADGMFSFKNVPAGVYDLRFFKQGYVWGDGITDSLVAKNIQFVGNGRFLVDEFNHGYQYFYSILEPDSTYWALKPDIEYEITKEIKDVYDIWLRDTTENGQRTYIYGRGTKETRKIRFTLTYERPLPLPQMKRIVKLAIQDDDRSFTNDVTITTDANVLSGVYEYNSPNVIIRDSLGKVLSYIERPGSLTSIRVKEITVQAISNLPNDILHKKDPPKRAIKSNKLTIKLTD